MILDFVSQRTTTTGADQITSILLFAEGGPQYIQPAFPIRLGHATVPVTIRVMALTLAFVHRASKVVEVTWRVSGMRAYGGPGPVKRLRVLVEQGTFNLDQSMFRLTPAWVSDAIEWHQERLSQGPSSS